MEPWGDDWMQTGSMMALYANRHSKKGQSFYPQDFIPFQDQQSHREQRLRELKKAYEARKANAT